MSNSDLLLSICVPTYNRQFLLERNVSFHLEHFRRLGIPFEIVIVDDCSTDTTDDYVKQISMHQEINAFRRVKNSGFVSNYAFAMQRARGRYAVFLGDDDLLIPEKVAEYIGIMERQNLGMLQAPWMLVDTRPGGGDMGPFYRIPQPTKFQQGEFGPLLRFIFKFHVFPEFMIVRRDVLARSISSATPFIFWAYLFTTRALDKADVLFVPEPFARVTAISDDPRMQQGNGECMFQWDTYRGGLEYLASQMWRDSRPDQTNGAELASEILSFMMKRQSVALGLHVNAKNWAEAYILYHRMAAYCKVELGGNMLETIQRMAGITTATKDAAGYSNAPVIVDPLVSNEILELLPVSLQGRTTRELPDPNDDEPRAWLRLDQTFGTPARKRDAVFDVSHYFEQFM